MRRTEHFFWILFFIWFAFYSLSIVIIDNQEDRISFSLLQLFYSIEEIRKTEDIYQLEGLAKWPIIFLVNSDFYLPIIFSYIVATVSYIFCTISFKCGPIYTLYRLMSKIEDKKISMKELVRLEICFHLLILSIILFNIIDLFDLNAIVIFIFYLIFTSSSTLLLKTTPIIAVFSGQFGVRAKYIFKKFANSPKNSDSKTYFLVEITAIIMFLLISIIGFPHSREVYSLMTWEESGLFGLSVVIFHLLSVTVPIVAIYISVSKGGFIAHLRGTNQKLDKETKLGQYAYLIVDCRRRSTRLQSLAMLVLLLMVASLGTGVVIFVLAPTNTAAQSEAELLQSELKLARSDITRKIDEFTKRVRGPLPANLVSEIAKASNLLESIAEKSREMTRSKSSEEFSNSVDIIRENLQILRDNLSNVSQNFKEVLKSRLEVRSSANQSIVFDSLSEDVEKYIERLRKIQEGIVPDTIPFWKARSFLDSLVTRVGALVILFAAIQILGRRYESLMNRAAEYDALADLLYARGVRKNDYIEFESIDQAKSIFQVSSITTKPVSLPTEKLVDIMNTAVASMKDLATRLPPTTRSGKSDQPE